VDGSDVLGRLAGQVTERICAAATWPERFAVLDEVLSERLQHSERVVRPEVSYCWQRLLGSGGVVPVSALAAETGWSDRHLRSAFAAEIGLTPKAAARVIRFHRARRILQRRAVAGGALDIAGIAALCGYYDQAHLDLDFRSLGGAPPTIWVAEEFRNFQAFDEGLGEGLIP
jgi:AraC-like DNA-binding protein